MDEIDELLQHISKSPESRKLVLMPITRLLIEDVCRIGKLCIFPPGAIDIRRFRPIPNKEILPSDSGVSAYAGQDLREVCTSITGFDIETLANLPLVAFVAEIEWDTFLSQTHQDDIECLHHLNAIAEQSLDLIRFHFCRFDLPDTLPGMAGAWGGADAFLGALIYTLPDHESYLIAGSAIECSMVVKGIGLDLSVDMSESPPSHSDGEVGAVAAHGLSMFSDVMTASNSTLKFIRATTLIEFLANPDNYRQWQKLKGDIVCHIAKNKTEYHELMHRFKELASTVDESKKQGRTLNSLVPNPDERKKLFLELQRYTGCVLGDMLDNRHMTWVEFQQFRLDKKTTLGVA